MKRLINLLLNQWVKETSRKPLLLRGARQVGRTFAALQTSYAIWFSRHNYSQHEELHSYPLYAVAKELDIEQDAAML